MANKTNSLIFTVAAALIVYSCGKKAEKETAGKSYFDVSGMDTTVRPADNFYLYANGNWIKTTVIPDDQSGWGSFYTLYEDNLKKLHTIVDEAAASKSQKGSLEQKVGDYYASGMDTMAIEKLGYKPLQPVLERINAVKDHNGLMDLVGDLYASGDSYLIGFFVNSDDKNSKQNIAILYQTGLSLPEKEYYTRTDSSTKAAQKAFVTYATKLFTLCGQPEGDAKKSAEELLAFETRMSKSHKTPVELRDPQKNYHKMSLAQLEKISPNIGWSKLFGKMNVRPDSLNVGQPAYYEGLSKMLASEPIENLKTKLRFDYISNNANLLSKDFVKAGFEFDKVFNGQKVDSDRWKKMVNRVDNGLDELLGQLYVKKHFTDSAKKRMDELVGNLQKAFENRINHLDWMSASTKQRAVAKLNTFLKKIGYPEKWKKFDDVTIERNNYFANVESVRKHHLKEMLDKIGKPVDRTEWGMSPPTVNAYYNPSNNEIVFPAGILQFPFFDDGADDAINYGAIGMVIGHEMTHGFDDQGSQYDEEGNMKNWWGSDDSTKFRAKTGGVVKQYSAYSILKDQKVNGELTLGENIADIGGLAIAYDAFKLTKQGKDTTKIDGFTPDQRFFLGYAQVWRLKNTDEILQMRINTDPHSPEMFRVNGPLSNFDPFYTAYNVKEGDKMYLRPEERAHIW